MTILYFILAAAGLGLLVFIHELGHYFVAKKMGMIVEVFSIGFGKPFFKWRWHDVDWQLGWIPFGGYVKIAGMEFGKKDKYSYNDPYSIPNGFFSKSPWKRIMVALAGPFANFLLALLVFTILWLMGGREKPFSEFTHIVGWVEPQSELYAMGLRPGDQLTFYNGKLYTNSKDLLYATMLNGKKIELKGFHVDYATQTKKPFSYTFEGYQSPQSRNGILTTGVTATARYLIYDRLPNGAANPLPEGSPMQGSGIEYQDRLVWADGEYLFSMEQLSQILNQSKSFLTVKRDNEIFFTKQPRVLTCDLILPSHVKHELMDWQYEMHLKGRTQDLYMLPYVISSEGYVETPLEFIDSKEKNAAFSYQSILQQPLKAGDRIIAVDGISVSKGYQIFDLIQHHRVQLIVEKNQPINSKVSWREEDRVFENHINVQAIESIATSIGTPNPISTSESFFLLKPVMAKPINDFALTAEAQNKLHEEYESQKEKLEEIRDPVKKAQALKALDQNQKKLLLGLYLQDRKVDYNPNPWVMFRSIFTETWHTLKALISGYLNPKWISGPVGIVQVMHYGWQVGLGEALFWIAAISVNLGFLNLLPIPILDGGYITLSLWELITGRRLKAKTMERLIIPFVVLLFGLLIFLTFQDITRLF